MIDTYLYLLLRDKRVHKHVTRFQGGDYVRVEDSNGSGILIMLQRFEVTNIPRRFVMVHFFGNTKKKSKTLNDLNVFELQNATFADQQKVLDVFMEQHKKGKK